MLSELGRQGPRKNNTIAAGFRRTCLAFQQSGGGGREGRKKGGKGKGGKDWGGRPMVYCSLYSSRGISHVFALQKRHSIRVQWMLFLSVAVAKLRTSQIPLGFFSPLPDMHAKAVVDRSAVWEEDGSPDSTSRVPNIGDIDMSTVNRVLYQVIYFMK